MTSIWLAGAENPTHHQLFSSCATDRVAINIGSWRRNYANNWALQDDFLPGEWVAWSDSPATLDDLLEVIDLVGMAPTMAIGPDEWSSHPAYMVLWNGEDQFPATFVGAGLAVTDSVFTDAAKNRRVLASKKRDMLLGVVTGKTRGLEKYDFVISSAWWSAQKHGETQLWDGVHFHRVNATHKTEFRTKHAETIARLGVNEWDVLDDNPSAVAALAIRSWMAYGESLDTASVISLIKSDGVSEETSTDRGDVVDVVSTPNHVDRRRVRERHVLPSMLLFEHRDEEAGITHQSVGSASESLRQCNNCHLSGACPAFEPDHTCAYSIPVEIRTKDQLQKVMQAMIEIQTQRVFQSRFSEEITGQELDPVVGSEMDRLFRLTAKMRDIMDNRDTLTVAIQSKGSPDGGVLTRLFGSNVGAAAKVLDTPMSSDDVIDVIDS